MNDAKDDNTRIIAYPNLERTIPISSGFPRISWKLEEMQFSFMFSMRVKVESGGRDVCILVKGNMCSVCNAYVKVHKIERDRICLEVGSIVFIIF